MGNLAAVVMSPRLDRLSPSVRRAGAGDVTALTRLINRAHQVEAFFVDGDRIDEREVRARAEQGHFLVLDAAADLAAAVHVRVEDGHGVLGLLSVAPELQGLGLGKRLVAVAEALCTALGCQVMRLEFADLRAELGPWYRHLGYREVATRPFADADARPLTQACQLVRMHKSLPGA